MTSIATQDLEIDRRWLFVETLREMRERAESQRVYDSLMLAALLRKLLVDATSLVALVNRQYRLPIRFALLLPRAPGTPLSPFAHLPNLPPPVWWYMGDALNPEDEGQFGPRADLKVDELLAMQVMLALGHKITVRDLIHYGAHVLGAVHAGGPKTDGDRAMNSIGQWISAAVVQAAAANNIPVEPPYMAVARQLRAISRVVVDSLKPLEAAAQQGMPPAE